MDIRIPRRAIFFGRFQPFHLGHLHVAEEILTSDEYEELVFLIGMSSESHTERNPFTAGERIEMIRLSMKERGLDLSRVITATLPTMEIHPSSAFHAISNCPRAEAIYVGNPIMLRIFNELGFKTVTPSPYRREIYNGTFIRLLMKKKDSRWKELVPISVAEFIESIGGVDRIAAISSQSEAHILEKGGSLE
ncbi:MAG: nicotinamide-nucleotide adenylyltransferase [Fervidicoccaceae archaeon]